MLLVISTKQWHLKSKVVISLWLCIVRMGRPAYKSLYFASDCVTSTHTAQPNTVETKSLLSELLVSKYINHVRLTEGNTSTEAQHCNISIWWISAYIKLRAWSLFWQLWDCQSNLIKLHDSWLSRLALVFAR